MLRKARIPVQELNPYLTCLLCGGYLIDATTIIECLHSFCRTCIVHYLHTSNYCPVCECLVHKKNPHQNLRSDKTLQDVVYKLVPDLFTEEMRRRRRYYNQQTDESQSKSGRMIFTPDEKISLCLRLCTKSRKVCTGQTEDFEFQDKRYLLCPAQMSVYHLKKFLRLKYCLSDRLEVELFHKDEVLKDEYSLVDVSYITGWTREKVMVLNYAFYENPNKKFKRNTFSGAVSPGNDDSGIEDENSNQDGPNPAEENHVTAQSSQASQESDSRPPPADDDTPSGSAPAEHPEQMSDDVTYATDGAEGGTGSDGKQDGVGDSPDVAESEEGGGKFPDDDKAENDDRTDEREEEGDKADEKEECPNSPTAQKKEEMECPLKMDGELSAPRKNDVKNDIIMESSVARKNDVKDDVIMESSAPRKSDVIKDIVVDTSAIRESDDVDVIKETNEQKKSRRERFVNKRSCENTSENISYEIPENKSIVFRNGDVQSLNKSSNNDKGRKVPSPECSSITIEDDEGALQIVIDDSKSEKSSEDSGLQLSEISPNESDCVFSIERHSPSPTIKIPHPETIKLTPRVSCPPNGGSSTKLTTHVSCHNGGSSYRPTPKLSCPKTSTPFHSGHLSPGRKFPRYSESISFNDSGFSQYSSFHDSSMRASSCPQTDFDADEIWTDGVMDLSKPKSKSTDHYQEAKTTEIEEEEEEVERYTYVADDLEEGDDNMEIDSGYSNENKTPERYSLLSPDQNEVTSTRVDHVTYPVPVVLEKPQMFNPRFNVDTSSVWKKEKSLTDSSKKSSSGKHHKRRKSSDGSKHKMDPSKGHSKCTDVCNGHSVAPRPHSASQKNKQGDKLILNQPRCEKLIISQSRCEKAPNSKPRCEKLVVKLSKERNSEHYTATMS